MKKCNNCGALQDDKRNTCIDCGAVLPKKMTTQEEEHQEAILDDKLYGLSERADSFYVPMWAKILSVISLCCFVGMILFINLSPNAKYAKGVYCYLVLVGSITSVVLLAFPKINWFLYTHRLTWWFDFCESKPTPSFAYTVVTKVCGVIMFVFTVIGILGLVFDSAPPRYAESYVFETNEGGITVEYYY